RGLASVSVRFDGRELPDKEPGRYLISATDQHLARAGSAATAFSADPLLPSPGAPFRPPPRLPRRLRSPRDPEAPIQGPAHGGGAVELGGPPSRGWSAASRGSAAIFIRDRSRIAARVRETIASSTPPMTHGLAGGEALVNTSGPFGGPSPMSSTKLSWS